MGLYDYLNGEQVKCFYTAHYSKGRKEIYTIGGSMKGYNVGCIVPSQTMSYNYGRDFVVLDTFGEEYDIHFIQKGILIKSGKVAELSMMGDFDTVIDYYGQLLKAKNQEDFKQYHIDNRESREQYARQMQEYKYLLADIEEIEDDLLLKNLHSQYRDHILEVRRATVDVFRNKWFDYSGRCEANLIGRIAEAYSRQEIDGQSLVELVESIPKFNELLADYLIWIFRGDLPITVQQRYVNIVNEMISEVRIYDNLLNR